MRYNVAQFERLPMTALLTDRVFWPSHSVEMSGLYRVSHEHDHASADEVLCIRGEMFFRGATGAEEKRSLCYTVRYAT